MMEIKYNIKMRISYYIDGHDMITINFHINRFIVDKYYINYDTPVFRSNWFKNDKIDKDVRKYLDSLNITYNN